MDKPLPSDVMMLWKNILPTNYQYVEVFIKLTRQLITYLQERKEEQLLSNCYETLLNFIKNSPNHLLSPKFAKILVKGEYHLHELSKLLPALIHRQENLEELWYTSIEYFLILANLEKEVRIEYESYIIDALKANVQKPYSDLCIATIIKGCTNTVHYFRITELIESYIKKGNGSDDNYWQPLKEYHSYEKISRTEVSVRKNSIEKFLLIIMANAQRMQPYRCFSTILRTWESDLIPIESAINTFRSIILQIHPSSWRRIKTTSEYFGNLFSPEIMLCSTISIKTISEQLHEHEEAGLIFVQNELRNKK